MIGAVGVEEGFATRRARGFGLSRVAFDSLSEFGAATLPFGLPFQDVRMPALPAKVGDIQRQIEETFAGGFSGMVRQTSSMASSIANGVVGAVSVADPATGAALGVAVAAGSALGSLFGGLFGSKPDPPPPPMIAGVPSEVFGGNPLAILDNAVIAGKVVSGDYKDVASSGQAGAIKGNARDSVIATIADIDKGRSVLRERKRSVAFYIAHLDYDDLFTGAYTDGLPAREKIIGRLLGWAAPRVQVRELLANWFFYRQALAILVATRGNPNMDPRQSQGTSEKTAAIAAATPSGWRYKGQRSVAVPGHPMPPYFITGHTTPVPNFVAPFSTGTSTGGWDDPRRLADDKGGYGVFVFVQMVKQLAYPRPERIGGVWSFSPLMKAAVEEEIDYYSDKGGFKQFVAGRLWSISFPRAARVQDYPIVSPITESYADAIKHSIALGKRTIGPSPDHADAVEDGIDLMQGKPRRKAPGVSLIVWAQRQFEQQRKRAQAKQKAKKRALVARKTAGTAKVVLGVGAAATAAFLLFRG